MNTGGPLFMVSARLDLVQDALRAPNPSKTKLPDFLLGLLAVFVEDLDAGF